MTKRAFITGATGFIGGALAAKLAESGWHLTALVRRTSDCASLNQLGAELVIGDLDDSGSFADALRGCDLVFHCAGLTGMGHSLEAFHQAIYSGTRKLLDASIEADVEKFVFVSSIVAYELSSDASVYQESSPLLKNSPDPYGRAKARAEDLCMQAHKRGAISVRIVRPGFVYGPGDRRGGFLPEVASMIKNGRFRLMDAGHSRVPLIYISDLVNLLMLCAEAEQAAGQAYNACSNDSPTWAELTGYLCERLGLSPPKSVNSRVVYALAGLLELAVRFKLLRSLPISKTGVKLLSLPLEFPAEKAVTELSYTPEVSFQQGIDRCMPMLEKMLKQGP